MRQGENFKDVTQLVPSRSDRRSARRSFWRGGLIETLAALRYRDDAAYDEWLDERDTVIIAATLMRLSDRQLNRIGLSRQTLVIGVEDLKRQTERGRQIAREALRVVDEDEDHTPRLPARPFAAE